MLGLPKTAALVAMENQPLTPLPVLFGAMCMQHTSNSLALPRKSIDFAFSAQSLPACYSAKAQLPLSQLLGTPVGADRCVDHSVSLPLCECNAGWGLDWLWPFLLGYPPEKVAIIDEVFGLPYTRLTTAGLLTATLCMKHCTHSSLACKHHKQPKTPWQRCCSICVAHVQILVVSQFPLRPKTGDSSNVGRSAHILFSSKMQLSCLPAAACVQVT